MCRSTAPEKSRKSRNAASREFPSNSRKPRSPEASKPWVTSSLPGDPPMVPLKRGCFSQSGPLSGLDLKGHQRDTTHFGVLPNFEKQPIQIPTKSVSPPSPPPQTKTKKGETQKGDKQKPGPPLLDRPGASARARQLLRGFHGVQQALGVLQAVLGQVRLQEHLSGGHVQFFNLRPWG